MTDLNIGVIGLGQIGGSVTRRLIELNYNVYAYDLIEDKRIAMKELGAKTVENPQELLKHVSTLIMSLPHDESVLQTINNINFKEASNITIIEISTILPLTMEKLKAICNSYDVKVIDAPISGGPNEVKKGELSFIISSDEIVYKDKFHIFECLGKSVHYIGEKIGEAKAMKLMNNIMTLGNVLVASSSFSLGLRVGMDPQLMYNVLSQTGGTSHHFVKRFPKVINADYSPLFSNNLGLKDLKLALEWAKNEQLNTELLEILHQFYQKAVDEGFGDEDIVSVIKYFMKNTEENNKMILK
ncbi:NAD(P)-dependent oxidoreductase [Pseudalkalibacillus sp. A8]|uniref:NAD(P)-dependent oxidoreductase n=1 Tax=Pseudalkalibacillus sp. A8 TaxID=3382641 RepID=UPI0038B4E40D